MTKRKDLNMHLLVTIITSDHDMSLLQRCQLIIAKIAINNDKFQSY